MDSAIWENVTSYRTLDNDTRDHITSPFFVQNQPWSISTLGQRQSGRLEPALDLGTNNDPFQRSHGHPTNKWFSSNYALPPPPPAPRFTRLHSLPLSKLPPGITSDEQLRHALHAYLGSQATRAMAHTPAPPATPTHGRKDPRGILFTNLKDIASKTLDIATLTPFQYLDSVSLLTTAIYSDYFPIPLRLPSPIIFDKLVLLPLLIHRNKILLIVPEPDRRRPQGWKPPVDVYTLTSAPGAFNCLSDKTVEQGFEMALQNTLGLKTVKEGEQGIVVVRSLAHTVHRPDFGPFKIPGLHKVDTWIVGAVYEYSGLGKMIGADGQEEWPALELSESHAVADWRWWSWDEVRVSGEIDCVTKGLAGQAFKQVFECEKKVAETMREIEESMEEI